MRLKLVLLICFLLLPLSLFARTTHYVCEQTTADAGGKTGADWANCWGHKDTFKANTYWASTGDTKIKPGDTVYLDGGASPTGVTYTIENGFIPIIYPQGSGTAGNVITITLDPATSSRNYRVILDGERNSSATGPLIYINNDYITLDGHITGDSTRRIIAKDAYNQGMMIDSIVSVTASYLEIYNNGHDESGSNNVRIGYVSTIPASATPVTVSYCYIHDPYITTYSCATTCSNRGRNIGLGGSGNTPTHYGGYKIHNNTFVNADVDHIEGGGGVDVFENTFYNDNTIIDYDTMHFGDPYVRAWNNTIYGKAGELIYTEQNNDSAEYGHAVFMNNLIYYTSTSYASFALNDGTVLNHVYILNNTIKGSGELGQIYFNLGTAVATGTVSNIYILNNINYDSQTSLYTIDNAHGNGTVTWGGWGSGADVIFDYNIVYASSGSYTTNIDFDGTTYSWANHKTPCTYGGISCNANDASSPINPNLDASYIPTSSSPAVNKGVNLSSLTHLGLDCGPSGTQCPCPSGVCSDRAGAVRTTYDIGAYEYGASAVPTSAQGCVISGGTLQ